MSASLTTEQRVGLVLVEIYSLLNLAVGNVTNKSIFSQRRGGDEPETHEAPLPDRGFERQRQSRRTKRNVDDEQGQIHREAAKVRQLVVPLADLLFGSDQTVRVNYSSHLITVGTGQLPYVSVREAAMRVPDDWRRKQFAFLGSLAEKMFEIENNHTNPLEEMHAYVSALGPLEIGEGIGLPSRSGHLNRARTQIEQIRSQPVSRGGKPGPDPKTR
jgi:hypothetical protein